MKPCEFLRRIANVCRGGGGLLIGVDLKKDRQVLEAAYNDSAGVTAQFNLNLLAAHQPRTRRRFRSGSMAAPRNLQFQRRQH